MKPWENYLNLIFPHEIHFVYFLIVLTLIISFSFISMFNPQGVNKAEAFYAFILSNITQIFILNTKKNDKKNKSFEEEQEDDKSQLD